ncbi:MAG: cyclic pyranopterin monophosphate synthase MoaC [Deltaproteobacteria bacterium]|nr:MAG: cyclic pyranopterin monophosphate synthase MoaC [Deltaproteobacteria bacterium]
MSSFTHIDQEGRVKMVDVTRKEVTLRIAVAQATVSMHPDTLQKIIDGSVKKGNVLETARIAGIMAAKKTDELIPMCHPLNITHIRIDFVPDENNHSVQIEAEVRLKGPTGVEMEALTAVTVAALTIYDMCKSYDRDMIVTDIQLVKKTGGKSGTFLKKRKG